MSRLKEIFKWWEKYDNRDIVIKSERKEFNVRINKESLPHLLGLHYLKLNEKSKKIYEMVLNEEIIEENIASIIRDKKVRLNVNQRINTFKDFMENLDKAYIVEKTHKNTKIKSQYLAIDESNGYSRHLGLFVTGGIDSIIDYDVYKINETVLETYIVQDNNNYYLETSLKEPVKEILFYDEKIGEYRAGSFNLEKDRRYEDEALYKYLDEKLHKEVKIENEDIKKTEKEIFSFSRDDKEIEV